MKRTYSSANIRLPALTANNDVVLGGRLIDVANEERRLPAPIARRLDRVAGAHGTLTEALRRRVASAAAVERDRKEAHGATVAAWSALRARIEAHHRLPGDGSTETVNRIDNILFLDGLDFLRVSYTEAWVEADTRLGILEEQQLAAPVRDLCGDKFYDAVLAAHEVARQVIRRAEKPKPDPELRARHLAFRSAVRVYVAFLAAHADEDAEAAALSHRLLAPLVDWTVSRSRPDGGEAEPEAAAPPPAAPVPDPR
jgi:hypothetical protein